MAEIVEDDHLHGQCLIDAHAVGQIGKHVERLEELQITTSIRHAHPVQLVDGKTCDHPGGVGDVGHGDCEQGVALTVRGRVGKQPGLRQVVAQKDLGQIVGWPWQAGEGVGPF